jgi:transcriptional antiterminator RfaH
MQHWNIVQNEPQREATFVNGLRLRGVDPYNPIVWRTVRKRKGVMHDVTRPLFPGYLFVPAGQSDTVRETPGFWCFLRVAGELAILPNDAVEFVRLVEADIEAKRRYEIAKRLRTAHDFTPGQKVRITDGPLAMFEAKIERLDGPSQLRLLIEMFGGPTHAVVKANEIEAV